MKKICAIFFAVACALTSLGQSPALYHYAEDFYFVKEVPTYALGGKQFRFEIAVKSDPTDSLSKVRIHGIGAGKGEDDFLNSPFTVESRQEQDWTIYTVIGKVQPEAKRLWFYAAVNGNGNFYFDDLSFYIEDSPGQWSQLRLFNSSFEEKYPDIFAGYFVSRRKTANIRTSLCKTVVKTGKHSLLVKAVGATPATALSAAMR